MPARGDLVIDDFCRDDLISALGTPWRGLSDQVMGGVSQGTIALTEIDGRRCLRLTGEVRLENNGGFIQMAMDLGYGQTLDASPFAGVTALTNQRPPRVFISYSHDSPEHAARVLKLANDLRRDRRRCDNRPKWVSRTIRCAWIRLLSGCQSKALFSKAMH